MEHSTPTGIHYLTVQDVLWINLQLLKSPRAFRFAPLEEAVNAQYAYGASADVPAQAARLLSAFARLAPFDAGNDPTAFVATLAFLSLNGKTPTLPDSEAASWHAQILSGAIPPEKAIEVAVGGGSDAPRPGSVEDAVRRVLALYPETLRALLGAAVAGG